MCRICLLCFILPNFLALPHLAYCRTNFTFINSPHSTPSTSSFLYTSPSPTSCTTSTASTGSLHHVLQPSHTRLGPNHHAGDTPFPFLSTPLTLSLATPVVFFSSSSLPYPLPSLPYPLFFSLPKPHFSMDVVCIPFSPLTSHLTSFLYLLSTSIHFYSFIHIHYTGIGRCRYRLTNASRTNATTGTTERRRKNRP